MADCGCPRLQATSLFAQGPQPPSDDAQPRRGRRNAFLEGFSLHANTGLHGEDRAGLERLCVYGARGPLALSRLGELPDGRLSYRMKRKAPGGTGLLVLTPLELIAKLAALIPPPRVHLTRFHGVFANIGSTCQKLSPCAPFGIRDESGKQEARADAFDALWLD